MAGWQAVTRVNVEQVSEGAIWSSIQRQTQVIGDLLECWLGRLLVVRMDIFQATINHDQTFDEFRFVSECVVNFRAENDSRGLSVIFSVVRVDQTIPCLASGLVSR